MVQVVVLGESDAASDEWPAEIAAWRKEAVGSELQAWLKQLKPNHHGHSATHEKHDQGKDQVHGADILVIGREQPSPYTAWLVVMVIMVCFVADCFAHLVFPLNSILFIR